MCFQLLRARRNEKEMKVKPATSFKLLTIFIHKKNKIRFETKECKWTVSFKFVTKSLGNNPQEFIKQILWITVSDPTI